MIITFYSYKGGTGRTMALANVAALLAGRGHRVLAVDFDLEAPGLWRYFSEYHRNLDQRPGLIDLLTTAASPLGGPHVDWRDYVTDLRVKSSGLTLMTSGQLEEEYSSRVLGFGWAEFFRNARGGEFLERLRREWREEYDFTLIDSRTGITDSGGICTIMLPDMIIPVFVSNFQSIEGAVEVIARAQAGRKRLAYDRPPAVILPIFSRFEGRAEYQTAQQWLDIAASRFGQFYNDWLPSGLNARQALEKTKLPYVSYWSFGEQLSALLDSTSDPESLGYALNMVSLLIEQRLENAGLLLGGAGDAKEQVPRSAQEAPAAEETAPEGTRVFLSYAEEDREIAGQVATWLRADGFMVPDWPHPAGDKLIARTEEGIQSADAFLALVSPGYLASPWCRVERELAMAIEFGLQQPDTPGRRFLHVLKVRDTPRSPAGFLSAYRWIDLTNPDSLQSEMSVLADVLRSVDYSPRTRSAAFRDRSEELDRVLRGLSSEEGPHFWLVTAPPELGKSWLLDRIRSELDEAESGRWLVSNVDLRVESLELRQDADILLARLFGQPIDVAEPLAHTLEIVRRGRPRLYMLDSAELLESDMAAKLRSELGQVYKQVRDASQKGLRISFIVASRQASRWQAVLPAPRLARITLMAFSPEVIGQALRDLAMHMGRQFSSADVQAFIPLVRDVSEGLPYLLNRTLDWIEENQWVGVDRLATQEVFEELAQPYIEDTLFAQRSLLPYVQEPADGALAVLRRAFRLLVPHRQFTLSHLRYYASQEPAFQAELDNLHWSLEKDLWQALNRTSLLTDPPEPWQEIEPAIRRLLFRYYYGSDPRKVAAAHSTALAFEEAFPSESAGNDQAVGLVEALWHEATVVSITNPADITERLSQSARKRSLALRASAFFSAGELREYAAQRIAEDWELQEVLSGVSGLLDRLVAIVSHP
jgi:cellulose biosynthesis protein BcsQ